MSWRDYWDGDTPIYVNDRHKALHYAGIARDVVGLLPGEAAVVLDHGCGEALSADRVAARCAKLYLCDGAPSVRETLRARFGAEPRIAVIAPEEVEGLPEHGLDVVVVNSLLQYLSTEELDDLLGLWRSKLREDGRLVLADVIPHEAGALDDVSALLRFAWRGGFLGAALLGLARTAMSDYARLRSELGLTRYDEPEMLALLRDRSFKGERAARNLGHNQTRMTFIARPV